MNQWFEVDKSGLAALLDARGKSFAIFELIANAFDADLSRVDVTITPVEGKPLATVVVIDDSALGWADLSDAFRMFSRSRRGADPATSGRFCLGEKLALSLCVDATIVTMAGTIHFEAGGTRRVDVRNKRDRGTVFAGTMRMTRDELAALDGDIRQIAPRRTMYYNGDRFDAPQPLAMFRAKLPTVIVDAEGTLRPTSRACDVNVYEGFGQILELGMPICAADFPWRLDVMQKVPTNFNRDDVSIAFRRALSVAAVNAMANTLTPDEAADPWATEAAGDARATKDARRGDRRQAVRRTCRRRRARRSAGERNGGGVRVRRRAWWRDARGNVGERPQTQSRADDVVGVPDSAAGRQRRGAADVSVVQTGGAAVTWTYRHVGDMVRFYRSARVYARAGWPFRIKWNGDTFHSLDDWRAEFVRALNRRINLKAGVVPREPRSGESRLFRDQQRLRAIANRVRVYQFETDEVRRRFGHLLSDRNET